jgi:hypothetical protein
MNQIASKHTILVYMTNLIENKRQPTTTKAIR